MECKLGEDEKDCGDSKLVLGIVLGSFLLVFLLISIKILHFSNIQRIINSDVDIKHSNNEELEALVVNAPKLRKKKKACLVLFKRKWKDSNKHQAEAFNYLKVSTK